MMPKMFILTITCWICTGLSAPAVKAGVSQEVVEQTVAQLQKLFAREVAEVGVESFARQVARYAAEYGDDGLRALKAVGPNAMRLSAGAGEHAAMATRLMARHGASGADLVANARCLKLCSQYGDETAEGLLRHPGVSIDVVEKCGQPAVAALNRINTQNARRLAMLVDEPAFQSTTSRRQLTETIGRFGDQACDFIYRNKGALATATIAAAFFSNPEPFLSGTERLAGEVARRASSSLIQRVCYCLGTYPLLAALVIGFLILYFRVPIVFGATTIATLGRKLYRLTL